VSVGADERPVVIDVQHAWKSYRLYKEKATSLKERITKVRGDRYDLLWANQDVTLQVREGEVLGLIGHNGSGKSTLLRMMAGIQKPNKGTISIEGRVSALLELGAGFHPDLTGRENVYLNASILGMRRADIDRVFDDIVDFAGGQIPEFIDTPVKIYSSGMFVRLGFSVAVHLSPQILIIDEIIAVGDESFQRRCFEYLYKLRTEGVTIVMVSHAMGTVSSMCDRAVWLDHGRMLQEGPAPDVVAAYLDHVNETEEQHHAAAAGAATDGTRAVTIESVELLDGDGRELSSARTGGPLRIRVHLVAKEAVTGAVVGVAIRHENGLTLARSAMRTDPSQHFEGASYVEIAIDELPFGAGEFAVDVDVHDSHHMVRFDHRERAAVLHVVSSGSMADSLVDLKARWSVPAAAEGAELVPESPRAVVDPPL
jgi:ABC-type polysaccharide/polyol phosphate transport system ATPase subunit